MGALFEELAWSQTDLGAISLRRRVEPRRQVDVYEVKLDDEFLMSSLFTVAEEELAQLGLAATDGDRLEVVVGGLGLGYTAMTALADPRVASLVVIEALAEVIDWHERELLPEAAGLAGDERTRLVCGDFFALVEEGLDPEVPDRRFDAVLLDIDHSPRNVLNARHERFYTPAGTRQLAARLRDGGVFALWSNDPPDEEYLDLLRTVFASAEAHVVRFPSFLTGEDAANTVYVAR